MKSSRFNNTTASSWRVLLPRTTYSLGEGEVMREYRRVASQSRIGDLKGGGGGNRKRTYLKVRSDPSPPPL